MSDENAQAGTLVTTPAVAGTLVHQPKIPVTLSTASVYPWRAPHAFESAAELGYDGVEVMIWSDAVTQDGDELAKLAEATGVPITSLHAPTLLISQTVWGRDPAAKLERTVKMAQDLGVPTVVVHPPFMWQTRYAAQFEDQVRQLTQDYGICVAVENMYPWRPGTRTHRKFQAYRPGWDPAYYDYDAVTLDLSHAATAGQRGLELVSKFGSRLRHLHLADGSGSPLDEHLVPGRGRMDCAEVLHRLAATGWQGDCVVEITTRQAQTPAERRADLEEALQFARAFLRPDPVDYAARKPNRPLRAPVNAW